MSADETHRGWLSRYVGTAVDALAYAAVVTVVTVILALVGGVATGGGVVRAKLLLFLGGWLLLTVATVRLWPQSPADDGSASGPPRAGTIETTRIEEVAAALPPLRWVGPPSRRLSPPLKLFVASLFVLLTSLLLEVVFAVE